MLFGNFAGSSPLLKVEITGKRLIYLRGLYIREILTRIAILLIGKRLPHFSFL
jgi:hypothetical protein